MDPSYSNPAFGAGAGGQPQQPVFGAGGAQVPISSGTGDIVLAPEKKSHKGVIIALVLAVLIIGGLFAVVFLTRSSGNANVGNNAKLAFNKYANYILYGEDSDKALEGEYDDGKNYMIDELDLSDEDAVERFFSKADDLWGQFDASLSDTNNNTSETVADYYGNYYLISLIYRLDDGFEKALDLRLESAGEAAAKEEVTARYKNFVNSNYAPVKEYGQKMVDYYNLYVEDVANMINAGCFTETGCVNYDSTAISEQMENDLADASEIEDAAKINIVEGCWSLDSVLNGKTVISEGENA